MSDSHSWAPTVLLVGGGSGGHIFPNLAVAMSLADHVMPMWHFVVSERPLDAEICTQCHEPFDTVPAAPFSSRPFGLLRFARGFHASELKAHRLFDEHSVTTVVATGGFVSGPVARAAHRAGLPVALVSLDAVPGKANRLAARWASHIFSVYDTPVFPNAQRIGLPLRHDATPDVTPAAARAALGLPNQPTLLITAGSQGLASINRTLTQLAADHADLFTGWRILHLAGKRDAEATAAAYATHNLSATVLPFCERMGHAWRAADLALTLAGAGSVAEAWANAVPSILVPYPHHRDQHQRLNAQPMLDAGGAELFTDSTDPADNATRLAPILQRLMHDAPARDAMRHALARHRPDDGTTAIVQWVRANASP